MKDHRATDKQYQHNSIQKIANKRPTMSDEHIKYN